MSEQFGGQGISVRIDGKSRKVFVTKSGKFYYKQGNKKVYVKQNGAGWLIETTNNGESYTKMKLPRGFPILLPGIPQK